MKTKEEKAAYLKEYSKVWRAKNADKIKEYNKAWYHNNPDKVKQWRRAEKRWRKDNPDKVALMQRKQQLKKYGLSLEDYQAMLTAQKHCCAICNKHQNNFKRKFAIDHNHITHKNRGLLCHKCNLAIGYLNEDVSVLDRIREYLFTHN